MRLLLDMNLPPSVANWLRSEGHDALHVRDLGLSGAPDREVFARAAADGRIVVTFDLDFGEIVGLTEAPVFRGCAAAAPIGSSKLFARAAPGGNCRGGRSTGRWCYRRRDRKSVV